MSFTSKNPQRAIRRHHRDRLKAKRQHYWGGNTDQNTKAHLLVDTPKPCSCFMCGNPRRYWNTPTRKELQAEADLRNRV